MYRSILCLMWIALAGCMSESEPGAAEGEALPLSSDDSEQAPAAKPPAPPGKPAAVSIDERCIAKVKQCYAEGGDDKKCQEIDAQCVPPKPELGGCKEPNAEGAEADDVPACPAPPRPVAGAVCVTEKKNCQVDKDGRETCESIESDCTAPAPPGAPAPGSRGGMGKGCGEPVEPPAPGEHCTRKSVTCSTDKDGSEVCKTTIEPCAPGEPHPPSPPDAPKPD